MPPSRRNSNRTPRRPSRRDADTGRSRPGSSRRSSSESDRRSARQARPPADDNKKKLLIYGGAVLAGLFFILAAAMFHSTPRKKKKPRRKPVQQVMSASPIDWYTQGYHRGAQWKSATARRQMRPTVEEVNLIAERMTADYVNKGIDAVGEQRFIKGFKAAVLGTN